MPDYILEDGHVKGKPDLWQKILAFLASIGLILLSIQAYFYFIRPAPTDVPTLKDVAQFLGSELDQPFTSHQPDQVRKVIDSIQGDIKQVANFIAAQSCPEFDRLCQSKAIFYFVRDEINYVPDGAFHDQLENPLTVLKTGGADCEDMSVLLIALQKAIGNQARLVFVPGHVYAQVSISDYKNGSWVNLEATCDTCQFGELPTDTGLLPATYFDI